MRSESRFVIQICFGAISVRNPSRSAWPWLSWMASLHFPTPRIWRMHVVTLLDPRLSKAVLLQICSARFSSRNRVGSNAFLSLWIWDFDASCPWASELSYTFLGLEIILSLCDPRRLVFSIHLWASEFGILTLRVPVHLNSPIHFWALRFEIFDALCSWASELFNTFLILEVWNFDASSPSASGLSTTFLSLWIWKFDGSCSGAFDPSNTFLSLLI